VYDNVQKQKERSNVPMRTILSILRIETGFIFASSLSYMLICVAISAISPRVAEAQAAVAGQNGNVANALIAPGGMNNGGVLFGGANATTTGTQRGGAANADFDSLIDLIVSTVATETWAENGGGEAEVRPFPTGVLVDAAGTLRLNSISSRSSAIDLRVARGQAAALSLKRPRKAGDVRRASLLRYVSLPRLEREIKRRQKAHQPLDASMLTLAGLQRVRYVFVYPASGDVVLAGPAGDWRVDDNGRIVSAVNGEPVVRLDDLLTLLRRDGTAESHFGCAINPRQQALAKTQAYLASTSQKPLQPGQRKQWLSDLRDTVGLQDIDIWGVDPTSRLARVLVEADYHMKLIGMGLAEGVDGVQSYLASIRVPAGGAPPPMSVLRWWFALNYDAIRVSPAEDAFELVGQGVRVLSENELLAAQGRRVHTNQSDPLNRQFAESFTDHFEKLAKKYPVYGELRNVFDLAMAVALIQREGLAERVDWKPTLLVDAEKLRLPTGAVPRQVETVINHRVINRRHIVAGVSGGVMVAPSDVLANLQDGASAGALVEQRRRAPVELTAEAWWWD
jgi:hypothetical protein